MVLSQSFGLQKQRRIINMTSEQTFNFFKQPKQEVNDRFGVATIGRVIMESFK